MSDTISESGLACAGAMGSAVVLDRYDRAQSAKKFTFDIAL